MGNVPSFLIGVPAPSFEEKATIVDALLKCDSVRDDARRTTILNLLEGEYAGLVSSSNRLNVARDDVMAIVLTCFRHHPESFATLIRIVAWEEGNQSNPIQQLMKVLKSIFLKPGLLSQELLAELFSLVENLSIAEAELLSMYSAVKPTTWSLDDITPGNKCLLFSVLHKLKEARLQSDKTLPLLKFVHLISPQADQEVRKKLDDWGRRVVALTGATDVDIQQGAGVAQLAVRSFSYLLVTVDPYYAMEESAQEQKFYVRAWFLPTFHEGDNATEKHYEPLATKNELYTLAEIEQLLNRLTNQCLARIMAASRSHMSVLMIELFLRFAFLNYPACDMHGWKILKGFGSSKPVSSVYPLVVRSLDRLDCDEEIVLYEWIQNWNELTQQKSLENLCFLQREAFEKDLCLEKESCLAFLQMPPLIENTSPLPTGHIFTQMLSSGVSIALWPRCEIDLTEEQLREAYTEMLVGCHLAKVPEVLWEKRKDRAVHLAKKLTLFWDNPYRRPPVDDYAGPEIL